MTQPTPHPTTPASSTQRPPKAPYWLHRGWVARLLLPLSVLFYLISKIRYFWLTAVQTPYKAPVPVVVVGNITAGGAGKTPTTMALVKHLQQHGYQPAIVSRGYGRTSTTTPLSCIEVHRHSSPQEVGDEPLLMKQRTGVPVFVAAKRTHAVQQVLISYPNTNIILCDDGLQHYALARDIEIAVFDDRGAGNGWLIPAGPLREPVSRAAKIDLVLYNAEKPPLPLHGHMAQRSLGGYLPLSQWFNLPTASAATTSTPSTLSPSLQWQPLAGLLNTQPPKTTSAVAGIGSPERFFNMLKGVGFTLKESIALPDHYAFADSAEPVFDGITADIIFITEKDAAKCQAYQTDRRLHVVTLDYALSDGFLKQFDSLLGKLKSPQPHTV